MKNFDVGSGIFRANKEMAAPGLILPFPVLDFHYHYFLMEVPAQKSCRFLRVIHTVSSLR
jgi:hypothetical protein